MDFAKEILCILQTKVVKLSPPSSTQTKQMCICLLNYQTNAMQISKLWVSEVVIEGTHTVLYRLLDKKQFVLLKNIYKIKLVNLFN